MAAIKFPLFDHEDLQEIVNKKIEELKDQFVPKYVVENAIEKIMAAPIPDDYQDDDEKAAFADGQGEAVWILRECLKEAADDDQDQETH